MEDLQSFLDEKYALYHQPSFIEEDPISIPHLFQRKEDIEIAGFLVAIFSWGKRQMIIRNGMSLMERMDMRPYDFVMESNEDTLMALDGFVHRTFQEIDVKAMISALRNIYENEGGLEKLFTVGAQIDQNPIKNAIIHARRAFLSTEDFPTRSQKHLANPEKGSAAKRINMFLRWMVRPASGGVDFGLWKSIPTSQLMMPLDVHTGNVARKIGLLKRKQNDWKAVVEMTANLAKYCPEDPVKYDYSLFGLGIYEGF